MLYQLSYLGPSEAAATPERISSEAPLPCPAYFWPEAGGGCVSWRPSDGGFGIRGSAIYWPGKS